MLNIKNVNNKVKELVPKKRKQRLAVVNRFPIPLILAVDRVRHIHYNIFGLSHYPSV